MIRRSWNTRCSAAMYATVAVLLAWGTALPLSAAPPKVNYLFPAGVPRAPSTVVTAAGEFSQWPGQAWSSQPGVQFTPEAEKGKWRVTVAEGVSPGLVFVRMYDNEGAAALRPFMIGTVPEGEETEPNDSPEKANAAPLPMTWNGKLGKGGDVDCYAIDLQQGQTLVAAVRANSDFGSPMDAVLQLTEVNSRGDAFVIAQADDSPGLDPRLVYKVTRSGRYVLRVFGFPAATDSNIGFAGADTFVYRLTVTDNAFISHSMPLAVRRGHPCRIEAIGWNLKDEQRAADVEALATNTGERLAIHRAAAASQFPALIVEENSIVVSEETDRVEPLAVREYPVVISAVIDTPGDSDRYAFSFKQSQKIRFRIDARSIESGLDPHLAVVDSSGKQLAENDDSGPNPDSELIFAAPADGVFHVVVSDAFRHGGPGHFYRLSVLPVAPDFALTLPADTVNVAAGKTAEVMVNVERKEGYNLPVEIQVEGLPAGVTVAAVTSMPEGDSAKSVKLIFAAEAATPPSGNTAGRAPIRIVGRDNASPANVRIAMFVVAGTMHRSGDAWLTVTPAP